MLNQTYASFHETKFGKTTSAGNKKVYAQEFRIIGDYFISQLRF